MGRKAGTRTVLALLIATMLLAVLEVVQAGTGGNIDPVDKYAWSTNAGWLNFNTEYGGVTVYVDHLEGYAWAENIGWIRLGTHTGDGAHHYDNSTATDYGVNRDASGQLSGYAWSTNAGWISFNPSHGGVTIDPATGSFDGYAWGENAGWIHFKSPGKYNVVTALRQRLWLPLVLRNY